MLGRQRVAALLDEMACLIERLSDKRANIEANASSGAGIGSGDESEGNPPRGLISIVGDRFNPNAKFGAGISGANTEHSGRSFVIDARIRGAYITSVAHGGAAGIASRTSGSKGSIDDSRIESGEGNFGQSLVRSLRIYNGTFDLLGGLGAGWTSHSGKSCIDELTVFGGNFVIESAGASGSARERHTRGIRAWGRSILKDACSLWMVHRTRQQSERYLQIPEFDDRRAYDRPRTCRVVARSPVSGIGAGATSVNGDSRVRNLTIAGGSS
jgi:hypothetical protein